MKNENNTDGQRRKISRSDIELAALLVLMVAVSFMAGYYAAAARIAELLAAQ
jgi:hypothetical protein